MIINQFENLTKPLIIIPTYLFYPTYAGWIKQTISIIKSISEINFLVITCEVEDQNKIEKFAENIVIYRSCPRYKSSLGKLYFAIHAVLQCVKLKQYLRYVYFPFTHFPADIIIIVLKLLNIQSISRISGAELVTIESKSIMSFIRVISLRVSKKIIVLNLHQKKVLKKVGVKSKNVNFIRNPALCINEPISPSKSIQNENKKLVFGFVGYMTERKRLDVLLEALKRLDPNHKNQIRLLVVGPIEIVKGEEDYYVKIMNLLNEIDFDIELTGRVENMFKYYSKFDVYILPSVLEGMPNSLIEAMSQGVASIGSNIPGISEVITHKENGLLVKKGSVNDLRDKIKLLLDNKSILKELGIKGYQSIKKKHDIHIISNRYESVFMNK